MTSNQLQHKAESLEREDTVELIAQAKVGSHAAFEAIYRMHVGRVYAICLRILADRARAEEVTQKVFIRAWAKLNSFRGESLFSSWLYKLAINVILGELKCPTGRIEQQCAEIETRCHTSFGLEPSLVLRLDLEKAIALLPEQARIIFVLHDIEGLTYGEIAQAMKLAVGTCKAQLSRARKLLREALRQ